MGFPEVAALLEQNELEIIERWEKRARAENPALKDQDRLTVRDHLLFYLEDLIAGLRDSPPNDSIRQKAAESVTTHASKEHGRMRAAVTGYSIDQLIHEYAILRQVITDFLREENRLTIDLLEMLNRSNEWALLIGATEYAQSITRAQEKLASTLIHDIRNPLSAVRMSLELVGRARNDDKHREELVDRALTYVNRIDRMTSEILTAMRMKAGQVLELEFCEVELKESLRPTLESIHLTYPGRVNFEITREPIRGTFGLEGIVRMIENLITNSVKYGDPNQQITLHLATVREDVLIEIHNWGAPIPDEQREQIFISFNRAENVKRYSTEGWGLGLTFVRAAVDAHQGKIELESTQEEGTTFRVRFPKEHPSRRPL